jgi:hypothetical protein
MSFAARTAAFNFNRSDLLTLTFRQTAVPRRNPAAHYCVTKVELEHIIHHLPYFNSISFLLVTFLEVIIRAIYTPLLRFRAFH